MPDSYLLYPQGSNRGPIDFQNPIPWVDGISDVGADVHSADPEQTEMQWEKRSGQVVLRTVHVDATNADSRGASFGQTHRCLDISFPLSWDSITCPVG